MNKNQMTCDPERIELFLQQQLSDEDQTAFESHLDHCNDCRHRLEATAAGDDIWSEVRESLLSEPLPADSILQPGDSALDSATGSNASFSHDTVLKLLAPTDDDRMIGRLGTYEVVGVIGSGGMGVVLKALETSLNRYVAIKVLAPHLGSSGAARKRFSREAQAAAAVVHENVIEIHGVADAEGLPYLVMPYVRGPSLQRRLDKEGPLALVEILRIGMQAATGLAAAHAQGLVHRDVKPANILLADGVERVKLTDFGLARTADDASLTKTGIIAGTPQYMSPEQARGESVCQRSDLFGLGSVLYAMCTGRAPFRAETSYGVLRRITDDEPRPIREINPDIPEWLCQIIVRLMSKQPDDRFESAREVAELLEECLAHVQQPTAVPLPASLVTQSNGSPFFSISRRSLGVIAVIVTFGFSLLGIVLWQATTPPDIAGKWTGEEWGAVALEAKQPGQYEGSYTNSDNATSGTVYLKWSRVERRFNGTWREGDDRNGKISLRLVGDEIRGAWTTNKMSRINPGTPELADLLWVRNADVDDPTRAQLQREALRSGTRKTKQSRKQNLDRGRNTHLPKGLRDRLAPLQERLKIPSNASVKDFADRYEITAAPWHTTTMLVDGVLPSQAHNKHGKHNTDHKNHGHTKRADREDAHSHDTDHKHDHASDHTHKITHTELFADEGKLTVQKAEKGEITFELVGNAGFESDQIQFSAQRIVSHFIGGPNARMILVGNARLVNDQRKVQLTADRITTEGGQTVLEGNARIRRKTTAGKSEIVSADRLEMVAGTIKADSK